MAGIPFNVIENPFVLDLFKDLNPGYSPPSRTTLSNHLITEEYTRVSLAIDHDLEQSDNLTLNSHTNEFLIKEISSIIEKLGSDKFTAIVTDNTSNCQIARQNIHQMYPHIWNIQLSQCLIRFLESMLILLQIMKLPF
ncbi:unnamed protein product [Rhizophagus irregularis]|nr:unnamed protein product [Rhizophagus irregularis]